MIRPATFLDVDAMAAVWLRAALTAYAGMFPPEAPVPTADELALAWRDELESHASALVAVDDDVVVGTVSVREGWMRRLYVDPSRWGSGVGAALHDAAVALGATDLWVLEANDRARAFYERRGWVLAEGTRTVHDGFDIVDVHYRR